MSRLDYIRKKQEQAEHAKRGDSTFISFIKEHGGLVGLVAIILVVVIAVAIIGTNPRFNAYFTNENSTSLYLDENTLFEMPYTDQEKTVIKTMGSNIILCSKNKIVALAENGHQLWEIPINLNKPILSIEGEYILAADRGGRDIYLINGGKVILQTTSKYSIINAKVSSNGTYVIISDEPYFKGLVTVSDAKNNEIFVWHSGSAYIIDASIGADENKLALAVINTAVTSQQEGAEGILSGVLLFNLYETEPYKSHTFADCIITNVYKADRGFFVVTDKKAVSLDNGGEIYNEYAYDEKTVNKIFKSDSVLVLSLEDINGKKSIVALDNRAHQKCNIDVRQAPNFISAEADRIAYGGSDIVVCDASGKELYLLKTSKKYNTLMLLSGAKKAVGVTAASVDIVEIK